MSRRGSHGQATAPLHYPVDTRTLPEKGYPLRIDADEAEREALARHNSMPGVNRFVADLVITRWRADGVRVDGHIRADVVQECVATLEPVPATIDVPVEATFVPEGSAMAATHDGELLLDPNGEDPPEEFHPPMLDAGAVASEFLSLSLDRYPRAPDAELPGEATDAAPTSAFAALAALKSE